MITTATFDTYMARVTDGDTLSREDILAIADAPDLPMIGMLADAARRRLRGTEVSYLRVAVRKCDQPAVDTVPASARELRIVGAPASLAAAVAAVGTARAAAGSRGLSGFAWPDIEQAAKAEGIAMPAALRELRDAGLDALAEFPLDAIADPIEAIDQLIRSGFDQLRLTIAGAGASRAELFLQADALQKQCGCIQAIAPLPTTVHALRPTTGYDDVKAVAVARLAAMNIPTVQVDWTRYGPKLAQVALMFGADDLDAVSADDAAPDGRRRAPLEEVRRNIEAAGFVPAERDSRFVVVSR